MYKVSLLIEPRDKIEGYFYLIALDAFHYPVALGQVCLAQDSHFSGLLPIEQHDLIANFRDYGFEVGLVYFDECGAYGDFSHKGFDNLGDLAFPMMEGGVYLMRLDLNSDAWPNPFYLFLPLLPLVLFLQLFVKFLDVVHLLIVNGSLILDLPLQIISGIEGRSLIICIEAVDAELQLLGDDHNFALLLQSGQLVIQLLLLFHGEIPLPLHPTRQGFLQLLLLPLALGLQLFLLGCIHKILRLVDGVDDLAIGGVADDLNILDALEKVAELRQVFPLGVVELQELLLFDEFVVELLEVPGLAGVLGLDELNEPPLELAGGLFDVFQGVAGEVPHAHLVTLGVEVALEAVFVLALLPAELAEVLEPLRRHESNIKMVQIASCHIMNNEIAEQQALAALRQDLALPPEELAKILADRKRLTERVEEFNNRAVICIGGERWEQALVYLEAAEQLLESAAVQGLMTDRCLVQCILHNEANCYQNLWQLEQCSSYIEALIFNFNSRKNTDHSSSALTAREGNLGLAQYYLQFCAINSQLSNHSGALISARKSLHIIRSELSHWRMHMQQVRKPKGESEEKIRLLNILCRLNDSINLNLAQTLVQATGYYLKSWKMNGNSNKSMSKQSKEVIQKFSIKSIMALGKLTLSECIARCQSESETNLAAMYQRIFGLATCYFTIATELRLISIKKSRERNIDKSDQPEYKESQIYHLLSILVLALTLPAQSPFMAHLLLSFQNHYGTDLANIDAPFRKVFSEIVFIKQERNLREPSIEISEHEEVFGSHLSKGSGTMIRKTKGSKESERENKFSWIDPKSKKSKLKHPKKQSKSKKDIPSSKSKHPRQSLSKSPIVKTGSKESIIIKSQRSKESLHQRSPIPSIKLISNPSKTKISNHNGKSKSNSKQKKAPKSKRKTKLEQNQNEYFLVRKRSSKKQKKTSVSSKKSSLQPRSTGRLPIDSTLQTKDHPLTREKKKPAKKSILQHYL